MSDSVTNSFRSVLPHEPLPLEELGYVQIQGALLPKEEVVPTSKKESSGGGGNNNDDQTSTIVISPSLKNESFASIESIESMLKKALSVDPDYLPSDSPLHHLSSILNCSGSCDNDSNSRGSGIVLSVTVILEGKGSGSKKSSNDSIDTATGATSGTATPITTKARLTFPSPTMARTIVAFLRQSKIAPADLFQIDSKSYHYSTKQIQATHVTQMPLPNTNIAWARTGMPKFRRLLIHENMYHDANAVQKIQYERSQTRFVFMTNIVDYDTDVDVQTVEKMKIYPHLFQDAIRNAIQPFLSGVHYQDDNDASTEVNLAPEIFVPSKKQLAPFKYCHIGTRSPADAQALIKQLQGKQITLGINDFSCSTSPSTTIVTGKLYLDFADVTVRSAAKSNRMQYQDPSLGNSTSNENDIKGETSKPECTSSTNSIVVPGLFLKKEIISLAEEQVLLACLVGPNAPWAPVQSNSSKTGHVKRRVQHYGYVFDYETANVLREFDNEKAMCPPLPCLPEGNKGWTDGELEEFAEAAVRNGSGWDVLAAVVERVRRYSFAAGGGDINNEASHNDQDCNEEDNFLDTGSDGIDNKEAKLMETDSNDILPPSNKRFQHLNQLTVNEYKRGQGIGAHIDTQSAFSDGLISISLGSDSVMEFRNEKGVKKMVHLPPRSLLLMSGLARYTWSHQIVTRMTDCVDGEVIPRKTRVSLTLRTAITLPVITEEGGRNDSVRPLDRVEARNFPPRWGTQKNLIGESDDDLDISTPETERNHVHAVYDAIATQWHHTRGKRGVLWPGATRFLQQLPKGSIVADVGCGDGKYFPAIWEEGSYVIGTDISEPLLQTSIGACASADPANIGPQNRQVSSSKTGLNARPAVAVADCMHIPLRSKSCDAAICIAVMHHLSTSPRRIRCLQELSRVVKKGGMINIQAWALEQEQGSRRKFAGTDVFVPFNAQPRYLDKVQTESKQSAKPDDNGCKGAAEMYSDAYDGAEYDERKGLVVFQRYCHMYKEGELENLVSKIDSLEIVDSGFESGNHFVILKVIH